MTNKDKALQFIEENKNHYVEYVNGQKCEGFTITPEKAIKAVNIATNWRSTAIEFPIVGKLFINKFGIPCQMLENLKYLCFKR